MKGLGLLAFAGDKLISAPAQPAAGQAANSKIAEAASPKPDQNLGRALRVWKLPGEWKLERTIGSVDDPSLLVDRVLSIDFSPDGKLLATGGGLAARSGQLKIWNVADGKLVREIPAARA